MKLENLEYKFKNILNIKNIVITTIIVVILLIVAILQNRKVIKIEQTFERQMYEKISDQILIYSSFDNSTKYMQIDQNGIKIIATETLNNDEYIGIIEPCVVDDGIYYTSYAVELDTYCVIKKNNDTIEFILPLNCEFYKSIHKLIKNDILYYGYDNVLYSYNLLNGEQKILLNEEIYLSYNEAFDVSENGDIVYSYEYVENGKRERVRRILKNDGDIINIEANAVKFLDENELLCTSENELYRYNIVTDSRNTIMKVSNGGLEQSGRGYISQIVLTNDKETAIIEEIITDNKTYISYYRMVELNSGENFRINRGESYPFLILANNAAIKFAD